MNREFTFFLCFSLVGFVTSKKCLIGTLVHAKGFPNRISGSFYVYESNRLILAAAAVVRCVLSIEKSLKGVAYVSESGFPIHFFF